jgi:hypothetical protein
MGIYYHKHQTQVKANLSSSVTGTEKKAAHVTEKYLADSGTVIKIVVRLGAIGVRRITTCFSLIMYKSINRLAFLVKLPILTHR